MVGVVSGVAEALGVLFNIAFGSLETEYEIHFFKYKSWINRQQSLPTYYLGLLYTWFYKSTWANRHCFISISVLVVLIIRPTFVPLGIFLMTSYTFRDIII